ncbi:MAG: fold metallo-hydrolase [Thermoleophilia bacterium]|nr:fold metallo-hydrolase [Thermoleophilia bacterium]
MHVAAVTPNLIQLRRFGAVNCWLVRDDDGFTLVDTGLGGGAKGTVAAAAAAGAPIVRVLLTHAHSDHVGSLDALARLLPDVEVGISARDARFLAGDRSFDPGECDKERGAWTTTKTVPTLALEHGVRVGSLEVIATPGHTPGHRSFRDTRDGTVIGGDVLTTFGGVHVTSHPNRRFPLAYYGTANRPLDLSSAAAIAALDPTGLAVGHGPFVPQPAPQLAEAIARAHAALRD